MLCPLLQQGQEPAGGAVVEPPLALLQVEVEVLPRDAVVAAQVPFGLVPEVLDTVDVPLAVAKALLVVDPHMAKLRHVEHVVGTVTVCIEVMSQAVV